MIDPERLERTLGELIRRSGWPGAAGPLPVAAPPEEERLWQEAMAGPDLRRQWSPWLLGTSALAVAAAVLVMFASTRLLRERPPSQTSPGNSDPVAITAAKPREAPAPPRPAAQPQTASPPPSPRPTVSIPATPLPAKPRRLAAPPPLPPTLLADAPPTPQPGSPPVLTRSGEPGRSAPASAQANASELYASSLCFALSNLIDFPEQDTGLSIFEVALTVEGGRASLKEPPQTITSGGEALDAAARTALEARPLPGWPHPESLSARYLLVFDVEQQKVTCKQTRPYPDPP
ncbi:hypothetical protein [Gloeobacter morelensis]|uniref:TonB C-terminal domain-containing protein n=1 Tax=Gloeobacter morelensis MG652769 TaxID=2781736 RepID=A0ABY3PGW7_9CYAN|nr:hypothetical protein [Gloeobacter morelensis]UFP92905.1 hypothetical protein ISF26_13850 [Gloeobacter morelensis MG652769]